MAATTASKREKRLKIASWILLTVIPSAFAAILIIFNYGGSVQGYTDKIDGTEKRVTILEPKFEKFQTEYLTDKAQYGVENVLTTGKVSSLEAELTKKGEKIEKIETALGDLTKTVTVLTETVKHISSDAVIDREIVQNKLDGILKAIEERK